MLSRWPHACAGALALALAACAPSPPPGPSYLLVSIDSLRADRLGCYGAERDTSPALDRLAAGGIRFDNAVAPTSWTLPSHVSLLTGLPVPVHRVNAPTTRIDPNRALLAEHLGGLGYRTAAFVSAPFLHRAYGFDRGFDVYENLQGVRDLAFPPSQGAHDQSHLDETAPQVIDAALAWLEGQRPEDGPFLLFVHLWDVHYDFLPPAPYDTLFDPDYSGDLDATNFEHNDSIHRNMAPEDLAHLKALYDGEIRWLDSQLARLLEAVQARESRQPIVISVLADHGDEFFEHGEKGHYRNLYEESVRVPWILRQAGVLPEGQAIHTVAGLDDVAPTLLGLGGLPPLPEAMGRDLSDLLRGASIPERPALLVLRELAALRGSDWKIVLDTHSRYAVHYDLASDPGEERPEPARRVAPEKLAQLEARLIEARKRREALTWSEAQPVELDPETLTKLRELGYVE